MGAAIGVPRPTGRPPDEGDVGAKMEGTGLLGGLAMTGSADPGPAAVGEVGGGGGRWFAGADWEGAAAGLTSEPSASPKAEAMEVLSMVTLSSGLSAREPFSH